MQHPFSRRTAFAIAFSALAALTSSVWASDPAPYPTKPIRIVVPFPPGGYSDALARIIATDFTNNFGQSAVVENRPGAGGNIGADLVSKSPADGYTLGMGTIGTQVINPLIYARMPYNAAKDFSPVSFIADAETVLVVHPKISARSVKDLIALAKARPGELTFASGGPGTTGQLAGELFKVNTNTALVHVPYKGNVPALTDLVGGQVDMSFATMQPALPFIKSGQLIPLATLGAKRSTTLPNVPTLGELGYPNLEVRNWTGMIAPAGTPAPILQKLAARVDTIMQSAQVQQMIAEQGLSYTPMDSKVFGNFINDESAKWSKVVKAAGIKAD